MRVRVGNSRDRAAAGLLDRRRGKAAESQRQRAHSVTPEVSAAARIQQTRVQRASWRLQRSLAAEEGGLRRISRLAVVSRRRQRRNFGAGHESLPATESAASFAGRETSALEHSKDVRQCYTEFFTRRAASTLRPPTDPVVHRSPSVRGDKGALPHRQQEGAT